MALFDIPAFFQKPWWKGHATPSRSSLSRADQIKLARGMLANRSSGSGSFGRTPTGSSTAIRPNYPASYEHRYASQARGGSASGINDPYAPETFGADGNGAIDLNNLFAQIQGFSTGGEGGGVNQYDPIAWARSMINPIYDAQIAALNQAAQESQANAANAKGVTEAAYTRSGQDIATAGSDLQTFYDAQQAKQGASAAASKKAIEDAYAKSQATADAERAKFGIVGGSNVDTAAQGARDVAQSVLNEQNWQAASEAGQTSTGELYKGLGVANTAAGAGRQVELQKALAQQLNELNRSKMGLEGERSGKLQEMMFQIMQQNDANRNAALSSGGGPWDAFDRTLKLAEFLKSGGGGGGGSGGGTEAAGPAQGMAAALDFARTYATGKGQGYVNPNTGAPTAAFEKLNNFFKNFINTNSGVIQNRYQTNRPTTGTKAIGGEDATYIPMNGPLMARLLVNDAQRKGIKNQTALDMLSGMAMSYWGKT